MKHAANGITTRLLITKHQRIIAFSRNIENLYTYIALILFISDTLIICCLGFIIVTVSNADKNLSRFDNNRKCYESILLLVYRYYNVGIIPYDCKSYEIPPSLNLIYVSYYSRSVRPTARRFWWDPYYFTSWWISRRSYIASPANTWAPRWAPGRFAARALGFLGALWTSYQTLLLELPFQSKMIGDAAYDSLWYDITPEESRVMLLVILRSQRRLTITIGRIMDLSLERFTSVSVSLSALLLHTYLPSFCNAKFAHFAK